MQIGKSYRGKRGMHQRRRSDPQPEGNLGFFAKALREGDGLGGSWDVNRKQVRGALWTKC